MKVESLIIRNVGKIENETITLNKPLILFYGEIRQGKTTILNAVRWVCGAPAPADIIHHGKREASIELRFKGGSISRRWYIGQDGETKADATLFIRDGKKVSRPADEIRRMINPFLLNQDHLKDMGETDRKKFFAEIFAVDTVDLDVESTEADQAAKDLRSQIKGYGEIDLTPVLPIDIDAAQQEWEKILHDHASIVKEARAKATALRDNYSRETAAAHAQNNAAKEHNAAIQRGRYRVTQIEESMEELEKRLNVLRDEQRNISNWLLTNKAKDLVEIPQSPDISDLQAIIDSRPDTEAVLATISNARAQQVRVEQYEFNKARDAKRQADMDALAGYEARMREIKAEKIAKLKGISDQSGIAGLSFDEFGNFFYEGTDAGMLSTSQIMKLSSELSGMYPEGMGIELLDRGESLGKSIFEFVEKAKAENKTILATIVGERPAASPPEVGVFVVQDGKITA